MEDKVLLTYIISDLLFLGTGALLLGFSLTTQAAMKGTQTADSIGRDILLGETPLSAAIGNAVMIFATFLLSLPALIIPTTRGWLKAHGFFVVVCALFSLIVGLDIWIFTLRSRENLLVTWGKLPVDQQSLLQTEFDCCGYTNSTSPPFAVDATCPNAAAAALKEGCISKFSSFANTFLDDIFTAIFGIVGIDVALILAIAMVLKDRKEKERYRYIDEKAGAAAF